MTVAVHDQGLPASANLPDLIHDAVNICPVGKIDPD